MRQSTVAIGFALLLGSASLVFAQQTPTDIKGQLERQGYSQVQNIQALPEAMTAQAVKDGKYWNLVVDYQGKIIKREQRREPSEAG